MMNSSHGSLSLKYKQKNFRKLFFIILSELNNQVEDNYSSNISPNNKIISPIENKIDKGDVNNQFKLQLNSMNSSNSENNSDGFNINNEINFKETYVFMIKNIDYKFSFVEKKGKMGLSYYKCSSDDNTAKLKSIFVFVKEFKNFYVVIEDGKYYHNRIIRLRFDDSDKSALEIVTHVKDDYEKFVSKLEKYVKKASS